MADARAALADLEPLEQFSAFPGLRLMRGVLSRAFAAAVKMSATSWAWGIARKAGCARPKAQGRAWGHKTR